MPRYPDHQITPTIRYAGQSRRIVPQSLPQRNIGAEDEQGTGSATKGDRVTTPSPRVRAEVPTIDLHRIGMGPPENKKRQH